MLVLNIYGEHRCPRGICLSGDVSKCLGQLFKATRSKRVPSQMSNLLEQRKEKKKKKERKRKKLGLEYGARMWHLPPGTTSYIFAFPSKIIYSRNIEDDPL